MSYLQGLWSEINGATQHDLKFKTNSGYELMSRAISMRGAGGLCGSILGTLARVRGLMWIYSRYVSPGPWAGVDLFSVR